MRRVFLILCLLSLAVAVAGAQEPYVEGVVAPGAFQGVVQQDLDLWVTGTGQWSLLGEASPGFEFVDPDGVRASKGLLCSGIGKQQSSHVLVAHFDSSYLGAGRANPELKLTLEGALGILGLPLPPEYWILPLNNHGVRVVREDLGQFALASGEWFLLKSGDQLFSGDEEVFFHSQISTLQSRNLQMTNAQLWWDPLGLAVEAGDQAEVCIKIQGPQRAGVLTLRADKYVHLGSRWSLNGDEVLSRTDSEHELTLFVPQLPPGVHELTGTLHTFLPWQGREVLVTALWQGQEALLSIQIDRSWFDFDSTQLLQIDAQGPVSLIMPDGRLHGIQDKSTVPVESAGLDLVVPLDFPENPIWLGFPLAETMVWQLEPGEPSAASPDFFVPILLWDQGFAWRLVTANKTWFFDATADRQVFRGQFGPIRVESLRGRFSLANIRQPSGQQGAWYWQETLEARQGSWRQGPWLWKIELPKEDGKTPLVSGTFRGDKWLVGFSPNDVVLKYRSGDWVLGTSLGTRSVWVKCDQGFRLKLTPKRLDVDYRYGEGKTVNLQLKAKQDLRVQFAHGPWEAYLKHSPGSSQVGLRFKQAASYGRFLSLSKFACEVKSQTILFELNQQFGYRLAPWCTLYVQGTLGASRFLNHSISNLDINYGTGLILTPLPQVLATFGWHSELGWHYKAGVTVPFVGRKTTNHCE